MSENISIRSYNNYKITGLAFEKLVLKMIKQIDFDFSQFDKEWATKLYVVIRTEILDKAVKAFIGKHPDAVVINLGCGLDTRFFRVDNGRICWYDLDLQE